MTRTDERASAVRTAVTRLRAAVGPIVIRTEGGYALDTATESDVGVFRESLAIAAHSTEADRIAALRQALDLWRGEPFGAYGDEHWALAHSTELRTLRSAAVEDLAESLIGAGDPAGAIAALRPHLVDHPLDERPVGLLMRAAATDGNLAGALAEFQRLQQALGDIGLVPSGEIRRLENELIRQHERPAQTIAIDAPGVGRRALVFTEVVGSSHHWATSADAMSSSMSHHDRLMHEVFEAHDGFVFSHLGDGFGVAFPTAEAAVAACIAALQAAEAAEWPGPTLDIRMGVSVGTPEVQNGTYRGETVHLAARLAAAANPGQALTEGDVRAEAQFDGRDLGQHLLRGIPRPQHVWQVGQTEHPPLLARSIVPVHLPSRRTDLIGRDDDIESLAAALCNERLVTLTGAGGTGKTVLALAVARHDLSAFPSGIFFVDLAPVEAEEKVMPAFASALQSPAHSEDIDPLLASPEGERMLLVVDNCEHLLDETQTIIDRIIDRHAHVHVLATSREALQLDGERTHRVTPLGTSIDGPAIELFITRGRAARPDTDLSDRRAIAQLCDRLDGMPLAIEMAAARLRSMTVDEISNRLDDRFRLLAGTARRSRSRQQTLEAVIAWSYDLLSPGEQRFLRRMSVFIDGFSLDAAAAVADVDQAEAIDMVDGLVNKSLIEATTTAGESRYRLFESTRIFARQQLEQHDEPDQARDRHAAHFASRWSDEHATATAHRRHLIDGHNIAAAIDWVRVRPDEPCTLAKLVSLGGSTGALIERRWGDADAAELVRQLAAAAESAAVRNIPELHVPFIAASILGSFAEFTDDEELRAAVERFDPLVREAVATMATAEFRSTNPSCGILLLHRAHHLLPTQARRTMAWAEGLTTNANYAIAAMARMVVEVSRAFLDPSDPTIDPQRIFGHAAPPGPWMNAIAANAAYLAIVTGELDEAADLLETAASDAMAGSMSDLNRLVGNIALALSRGRVADAMGLLTDKADDIPFGVPGRESTYLALCAWARHLIGHKSRAHELLDHTVKRLPHDYLLTCHIKSIIDQWAPGTFHQRSVAWHDEHTAAGSVANRITAMPAMFDSEVRFWSSRRIGARTLGAS